MLSPEVQKKLEAIERRFEELTHALSDPAVASSGERFKKVSKERAGLESTVEALRAWQRLSQEIADNEAMLADPDLRELAKEELAVLRPRLDPAEAQLKLFLIPRDPSDDKDVIVEVRAGAGGDEAGLFAGRADAALHALRGAARLEGRACWTPRPARWAASRTPPSPSPATPCTPGSSTSRGCTGCSGCRPPRRRGASTPRRSRWR